jgi:hypothetical protein
MKHNILAVSTAVLLLTAGLAAAETPVANSVTPSMATPAAPAQSPQGVADCSKAADPAKCKAKRAAMREHIDAAKSACAGKQGEEHHRCVTDNLCAKSAEPRKCQERAKARAEHRPQALQACVGKRGPAHRDCMREEYRKLAPAE